MTELNQKMFNFKDSLSDEKLQEYQEEIDNMQTGDFIQEPGIYNVTIAGVSMLEQKDPVEGWVFIELAFKDTNGKKITSSVPVPTTTNLEYPTKSGKNTLWAVKKLQDFGKSIGVNFAGSQMFPLIQELFGSNEALIGKTATVRVGHQFPAYMEQYGDGFAIISGGKPIMDPESEGDVLEFPTKTDVEVYALQTLKKKVSFYVRVLEFLASEVDDSKEPAVLGM